MPGAEIYEKLPNEIYQQVDALKKFIREQKAFRDQKFDTDTILEISKDVEEFRVMFERVSIDSDKNYRMVQKIKEDTDKLLRYSESHSSEYFNELSDQYEARMKAYGEKIKDLKMSLDSIMRTYNVDELFKWLKKQHETLGEIAARIYLTHERIMEKTTEMQT